MVLLKEFKEFALKGNVLDLAIGVIIGAAFGKIVNSAVSDLIMPPIGWLIGGINFTDLNIVLPPRGAGIEAITINYGNFLQTAFDFLIIVIALFIAIKAINRMRRNEPEAPTEPAATPEPSGEEKLLSEIRDLLKNNA